MRPDEMLIPVGEARELTPAEMAETQHEDPEVTLITEYLLGELTGDAREAVARRLEEDSAFRGRVGMIVAAWEHWPGPQDFALPAHEVHASWERWRRGCSLMPHHLTRTGLPGSVEGGWGERSCAGN
jgi:anti-sigma-K factor RskA